MDTMTRSVLDREEYIEQRYFFRTLRERMESNIPAQTVLDHIHEEILSITRLPMAVQFLATELKHAGLLSSGFARLPHYFAPFQTFVIRMAEAEGHRFGMQAALLILELEADYRAREPTRPGLFTYQFETLCRNRLGYDEGLTAMKADPLYDREWQDYIEMVRRQVGAIDFADLIYVRSELYIRDQRKADPDYEPPVPPLFAEKEGRIAWANRGRDPLYLFAALQRQLGYPVVPRPKPDDDTPSRLETLLVKMRELEARIKLLESETKGQVDLSQFAKPELLKEMEAEDEKY